MFKTCAKHVGQVPENPRTTFHTFPTTPKANRHLPRYPAQKTTAFAPKRTHFVHNLMDRITGVKTRLSTTSTMPTTAITIYI